MTRVNKHSGVLITALIVAALVTVGVSQLASATTSTADGLISQTMVELGERGVPVKSWSFDGTVLEMLLQSESTDSVGTPDDPISLSLAQRAAFLAKSRGAEITELKLEFLNAKGQTLFVGDVVMDKELDPSWLEKDTGDEADALEAVRTVLLDKAELPGLSLKPAVVSSETGVCELRLAAVAADATSARASTAALMISLYNAVNDVNYSGKGRIALAFVDITDKTGQPLLKWVYDAQRGTQDWWQDPALSTDWFETP